MRELEARREARARPAVPAPTIWGRQFVDWKTERYGKMEIQERSLTT